jgi:hypothetical protein
MRGALIFAAAACLAAAPAAQAAREPTVSATVERNTIGLQEELILTVTVDDSRRAQVHLPPLPDFTVHERGQSTQVQIINGSMSTQVNLTYALTPSRVGTFVIGPVTASVGSTSVHSTAFEVHVTAAPTAPADSGDMFITAEVSNLSPVVGEQVLYTWRFFRRVRAANGHVALPEAVEGFIVRDAGPQHESVAHIDGQRYDVTQMQRSLFAQQAGPLTIPGSRLDVDVEEHTGSHGVPGNPLTDIFGRVRHRTRTLATPPLTVTARPLPQAPPDFTDLVGHFTLEAQLAQDHVQVGDSTTLTVALRGDSFIERAPEPALGDVPGLKVYGDKPVIESHVTPSGIAGSKIFKKALVPVRAGDLSIPALRLTYFDPTTHSYQTAETPALVLHAQPNPHMPDVPQAATPAPVVHKQDVKLLHDDILPPYRRLDALRPSFALGEQLALGTLAGLPALVYSMAWLLQRRRTLAQDVAGRRRRLALKQALARANAMQQALAHNTGVAEAATLGSRALREFLGDRLGTEGRSLTPYEARRLVLAQGVTAPVGLTVEGLLQRYEAAQYGAAHLSTPGTDAAQELRDLLKQLHRVLPA